MLRQFELLTHHTTLLNQEVNSTGELRVKVFFTLHLLESGSQSGSKVNTSEPAFVLRASDLLALTLFRFTFISTRSRP